MKRIWIGVAIFALYEALVVAAGCYLLSEPGRRLLFCLILGLLGAFAIGLALWYLDKLSSAGEPESPDAVNLDALVRDADLKIRRSGRKDAKSLASLPLVYVIGDENSAKTETVRQSGLDAELLAGLVQRDGLTAPTQLANLWLVGSFVLVEAGGAMMRQGSLWLRLVHATQPGRIGAVFSSEGSRPTRSVVVCVSVERLLAPSTSEQIQTLAQRLNERLRQLSQTLGISLPVYVLFTKLDSIAPFAEYVARLSAEEVKVPIGSLLSPVEAGTGLYAERAAAQVSSRVDEMFYALAEFRLEILSRGGELSELCRAYEFPRDLRKLRERLVSFLVEVARPSQLGVNPFLRGFFFAGMRAHFVDELLDLEPAKRQASRPPADSATRVFSGGALPFQQPPVSQPRRSGKVKIPQWVFLPHLFSNVILADKQALAASRASTKVNLLKRTLLASVSAVVLILFVLVAVSFFLNYGLAKRVKDARNTPVAAVSGGQFPAEADWTTLQTVGNLLVELDPNRRNDVPGMYRWWGLYRGDDLYPVACRAYSEKFKALLLGPTQENMLKTLNWETSDPGANSDYASTYNALKGYLLTTYNLDENKAEMRGFLAPVLYRNWIGKGSPGDNAASIANRQFRLYAAFLIDSPGCLAKPQDAPSPMPAEVGQARVFLVKSRDYKQIYLRMLEETNSRGAAFTYNSQYKDAAAFVVDSHRIENAFTREGFQLMRTAIENSDRYKGEPWVLGTDPVAPVDTASAQIKDQIKSAYIQEYIQTWQDYLNEERFVGYANLEEAARKLDKLDDPNQSPMLEFFSLISRNTAVPGVEDAFHAPQAIVPPTNPAKTLRSPDNDTYTAALQRLATTIREITDDSLKKNDPTASASIISAANLAGDAAKNLGEKALPPIDKQSYDRTLAILQQPIDWAKDLAKQGPAKAAGGAAKDFCDRFGRIFKEFPFNPDSPTEASVEDARLLYDPEKGEIGKFYAKSMTELIEKDGNEFRKNPGTSVAVSSQFLKFLNTSQEISSALFPNGATQPELNFHLKELKSPGYPDAIVDIDGKYQIKSADTVVNVRWISTPASKIAISAGGQTRTIDGPWSIFKFGFRFQHSHSVPDKLTLRLESNGKTDAVSLFEASDPGAALLDPQFMRGAGCVAKVAQ